MHFCLSRGRNLTTDVRLAPIITEQTAKLDRFTNYLQNWVSGGLLLLWATHTQFVPRWKVLCSATGWARVGHTNEPFCSKFFFWSFLCRGWRARGCSWITRRSRTARGNMIRGRKLSAKWKRRPGWICRLGSGFIELWPVVWLRNSPEDETAFLNPDKDAWRLVCAFSRPRVLASLASHCVTPSLHNTVHDTTASQKPGAWCFLWVLEACMLTSSGIGHADGVDREADRVSRCCSESGETHPWAFCPACHLVPLWSLLHTLYPIWAAGLGQGEKDLLQNPNCVRAFKQRIVVSQRKTN